MKPKAHKQAYHRAQIAREALRNCQLCPRRCCVDRTSGQTGFCGLDDSIRCYRELLYNGEEAGLTPSHQVYFAGCNLRCEFCTVAEWNENPWAAGKTSVARLKKIIDRRKKQGARTLNLLGGEPAVSIYGVLKLLWRLDPKTSVVWNSNMYYNELVAELLDGLVDVFLADLKVGNKNCAEAILGADDYLEVTKKNILIAGTQGRLIVRHIILPGHTDCCLKPVLGWLAERMPAVEVSLRGDYFPPTGALAAPLKYTSGKEFQKALKFAKKLNLNLVECYEGV